jgi:hypothetical protein
MKSFLITILAATLSLSFLQVSAQSDKIVSANSTISTQHLYLDVHQLTPGKVKFEDVKQAHLQDLATQDKYNTHFINFWVDEKDGLLYCLVSASDTQSIMRTHAEAHGLLPSRIYPVTDGIKAPVKGKTNLFLDVHYLGVGNVKASDVATAHEKDLAVEKKYGVNLINYWVDEKEGVIMCLAEAKDSSDLIKTHKEAHGLLPARVMKVKQGE